MKIILKMHLAVNDHLPFTSTDTSSAIKTFKNSLPTGPYNISYLHKHWLLCNVRNLQISLTTSGCTTEHQTFQNLPAHIPILDPSPPTQLHLRLLS